MVFFCSPKNPLMELGHRLFLYKRIKRLQNQNAMMSSRWSTFNMLYHLNKKLLITKMMLIIDNRLMSKVVDLHLCSMSRGPWSRQEKFMSWHSTPQDLKPFWTVGNFQTKATKGSQRLDTFVSKLNLSIYISWPESLTYYYVPILPFNKNVWRSKQPELSDTKTGSRLSSCIWSHFSGISSWNVEAKSCTCTQKKSHATVIN